MPQVSSIAALAPVLRAWQFVRRGVWERDYSQLKGMQWFLLRQLQVLLLVAKGMREGKLRHRAASLSLITLLSIVPFLAVVFSVFQAVGGLESLQARVEGFIYENMAVGAQADFVEWVRRFVDNIHGGAIGGVGTAVLLVASVQLLGAMESAFNGVWGVRRSRSLVGRFVLYWTMLTVGPLLLAGSLAATATVQGWIGQGAAGLAGKLLAVSPFLITFAAFSLIYIVIPNTRVKLRHALVGGLVAALCFELAKGGYTWVAGHLFRYNALYGSLGAIPVFIIWVNIGWAVILFGCEVTFANQNVSTLRHEERARDASERFRELLAARLMLEVCIDFYRGLEAPTAEALSQRIEVPVRLVHQVLYALRGALLVQETQGGPDPGYVPGRLLERISLADVVDAMRNRGGIQLEMVADERRTWLRERLGQADAVAREITGEVNYQTLARRFVEAEDGPPPDEAPEA